MRQGCISLGHIQCDDCRRIIPHSERYLLIDEEDGIEVENGKKSCYCVECCQKKGYTEYREEKGEQVLTFFPRQVESISPDFGKLPGQMEDVTDNE